MRKQLLDLLVPEVTDQRGEEEVLIKPMASALVPGMALGSESPGSPCPGGWPGWLSGFCCVACCHRATTAPSQGLGRVAAWGPEPEPPGDEGADSRQPSLPSPQSLLPRCRGQDGYLFPCLEGLTSSPCGSCDQGPDCGGSSSSGCSTPDDTSNSSSVDWNAVERQEAVPGWDEPPVMIPRRLQEGPRADSARRVTARSPVGGDSASPKNEDPGGGSRSAGQHWARLRGESGAFWERPRAAPTPAPSTVPQSGTRSSTSLRDVAQAASAQRSASRAASPPRNTYRDTSQTSPPAQQDTARTSPALRNMPRASSPSRITQRDNPGTSATQRSHPQQPFSSPSDRQQGHPRGSATQRDTPRASSPNRITQRDTPKTACAQRDTLRPSSPNRTTQRDTPKTACAQRDTLRASSPNRTAQRETPKTACAQRDTLRASSPNRTTQRDTPKTTCAQRDTPKASSPNRSTQRDTPKTACAQRDTSRASSPNRSTQWNTPKTVCAQRNTPRSSSPNRSTQQDTLKTACIQQDTPRASCAPQDSPKAQCSRWDNLRTACTQRNNPHTSSSRRDNPGMASTQCCTPKDRPAPPSPHRSSPQSHPRPCSPHRTNKDIPWASFPLRPTRSDGPRTTSPARSKPSEVPWASVALRPTQGDRCQSSSPPRAAQRDAPQSCSGSAQHHSPARGTSSSHNPGQQATSRGVPAAHPVPWGTPQVSAESSQAPCAVCIGHRDAPRASSPPRYLQHDPFPFFPEPRATESELPHHEPPYIPPAVCIGHRDAPRASSPPRHTQFDPFPFLPDTSDSEVQPPQQHDPPQLPPPVCIGYRDAPRASSPPRQAPEPSLLFQDFPRASTESLAPSTDSLHEPLHVPVPVCIGHRDAPSFSSPPRQAPEPTLFFQDPPGTSTESLAPSTDSLHGCPLLPPQVCIGYRDAPRASSPPRHPPSDALPLALSPTPGSSRGSGPSGETRHSLEREEYSVLADLPPPRRLARREPGPQAQGSNGGRTRSPGRAEVERLFGRERRKSEAPGAFQAREEGWSQQPSQAQSQLLRRQSSPTLSRQVTKPPAKQADPARRSRAQLSSSRSPERWLEGEQRLQGTTPAPRTTVGRCEREKPLESSQAGPQQPAAAWQGHGELPRAQGPHRHLERSWSTGEEGLGPGASRAPEGMWGGPPSTSWGQLEAWEELPAPRSWDSLQELPGPRQSLSSAETPWVGPEEVTPPQGSRTPSATGWGGEGVCPQPHSPEPHPELDWRDLLGLLQEPGEGAWARLPRLNWEGLLELLQARLPHKGPAGYWDDPAKASGPELGPPDTNDAPELESHRQPEGWAKTTLINGHSPGQWVRSPTQPPSPACTSTQWPKTQATSEPETSAVAELEEMGQLGSSSDTDLPSSATAEFQPEEPKEAEAPSRDQDVPTDQKQADSADQRPAEGKAGSSLKGRLVTSWRMPGDRPTLFNPFLLSLGVLRWQRPDLLNFKKGWMSILDEPGEWKKHWFVLTDSSLKYYRDSTAEEADELDGEIDLRSCTDVSECMVQRNYGFQIHTKDAVYTLSAMTSGIRRNWIEALRKTVRPASAPDVTKLSDCNKENTLHSYGTSKGSLKAGEQRAGPELISRGGPRKVDGQRQALDYVELSPLSQSSPQRARTPAKAPDRPAKQEELERDLAQRSEERRKWFEATDIRTPETPTSEGPRRGLGAPLTEDQQSRLSEEIEKKWQELEKLPLRDSKRVPLTALLNQSRGERRAAPSDSHEALEKEVQSLRAQLEAWRTRGEAPQHSPRSQEDIPIPPGYISQEACERSLAQMESSHQQVMEELQRHHERELQRLQQEKEWLLAEETAATAAAIEAMKKAYQEELSRELSKTRCLQQGPDGLRKQHQSDVEALKRELQVLSEQYSQKCLEIGALTRQAEEREHTLRRCQQEGQELLRHNQELHARLSEEIDRLRGFVASQGAGGSGHSERSSCELEVLLRVKEKELQCLKKQVQCLRDELQTLQQDKRFTSGKYQDVYVELNHIKTRSEREIGQLKEHLRLAMAALQEKEAVRGSLAE
ncbi:TRIO and F-actin-binding protein [Ochotona curzoniae]|uniref:TRIO and F-actin-binding protein n=1 Tax=Ochotona curzoniae TaxID=130825 RepID=UPI001B34B2E3|nr:TRIO and F-actin-binding protein [Ochotona curzoniae]